MDSIPLKMLPRRVCIRRRRYGYPALVAFSPSKLKFATLKSAFQLDSVKSFVDHVRQVLRAATNAIELHHPS